MEKPLINKKRRILFKTIFIVVIIILLSFIAECVYIVSDGLSNDNVSNADVIVVLGNKVNKDGSLSNRLKSRVEKAIELYNKNISKTIIVSGGIDKESKINEAICMKDYLVKNGIPEQDIIVDEYGTDTYKTAENSKLIMEKNNFKSVIVVSQYFHITRSKLAFRKVGIKEVFGVCSDFWEIRDLYSIPRDAGALLYYIVK